MVEVYDWSGSCVGLNGGGASSRDCYTITSVAGSPVTPNSEGCHNATGGLVGSQIGYRWQMSNWVFGVEGQGDWVNRLRGTPRIDTPGPRNAHFRRGCGL
ncbi:outer membrane protein [Bradyrhizobium sp.]|uniref:outer membrane protein n=1 Tax=Bradyrhizobium sp. TaxID=376 RepID=UPI003C657D83